MLTQADKHTVIFLRETTRDSLISDAGTFAVALLLIGIGRFIDSGAMEWLGALTTVAFVVVKAANKSKRLSVSEARAQLDKLEAGE